MHREAPAGSDSDVAVIASPPASMRLPSVDALRGFVMFLMLFVNDVAGVANVPAWMKHYEPSNASGMTFVDWVFPAFLFIVGTSIPLAFRARLTRPAPPHAGAERSAAPVRPSQPLTLLPHVLLRTAALLILGILMVNGDVDPARTGWPRHLWPMLVCLFGIGAFLAPPGRSRAGRITGFLLRAVGFAGLLYLALIFQNSSGRGLRTSWWGILGLIGWAYLVASAGYLLLRHRRDWMIAAVALLLATYLADKRGLFSGIWLDRYVDFGAHLGSHGAIALAGATLGAVLIDQNFRPRDRLSWAFGFGVLLLLGALLTQPLHGINKNAATPAWALISAAATCWLWIPFALLLDARPRPRDGVIARFFVRGGQNVLLAYLLMPVWYHLSALAGWDFYGRIGQYAPAAGIARALVAAAVVLWLAGWLKPRGVRLKL